LLSPIERYVWGAILAAVIGLGVYEHFHLIHEGEAKIEAVEAAHAKIVAAKDQQIEAAAQAAASKVSEDYETALSRPSVADTGLVCQSPAAAPNHSAPADVGPRDAGAPAPRTDDVFDPSGALLTDSRDADAQINALIDEVQVLQKYIDDIRAVK
jgi:hypothetical protein